MKKNHAEQHTRAVGAEVKREIKRRWRELLLVLGFLGMAGAPIISSATGNSEQVHGHGVTQPEPRTADDAQDHKAVTTPVAGSLDQKNGLPDPQPIPEPFSSTPETRTP